MHSSSVLEVISPFLFRHQSVLENLSLNERAEVLNSSDKILFNEGESLFKQGSFAKGAFLLQSGLVKIIHESGQGQRQVIYVYAPGEWIGYRQLLTGEASSIEAIAVGAVEVAFIPLASFEQLLRLYHAFSRNLLEALSQEFSVWVNRLTVFTRYPVRERLAICLLILYDRAVRADGRSSVPIICSRTDMADFIGATLETTVRTLSAFRSNGWLTTQGRRIILLDPNALAAIIGKI